MPDLSRLVRAELLLDRFTPQQVAAAATFTSGVDYNPRECKLSDFQWHTILDLLSGLSKATVAQAGGVVLTTITQRVYRAAKKNGCDSVTLVVLFMHSQLGPVYVRLMEREVHDRLVEWYKMKTRSKAHRNQVRQPAILRLLGDPRLTTFSLSQIARRADSATKVVSRTLCSVQTHLHVTVDSTGRPLTRALVLLAALYERREGGQWDTSRKRLFTVPLQ